MKFEIYNTNTGEVDHVINTTQEFADEENKLARELDSPIRYIPYREGCNKCGSEIKEECVCN